MGACGCGDYSGGLKFPGPDGTVYTLAIYYGCRDCENPAGVVIHRWCDDEDADWHSLDEPMKFRDYQGKETDGTGEFALAVADPRLVLTKLVELMSGVMVKDGDGESESFAEFIDVISDEAEGAVLDAFSETTRKGQP